MKLNIELIFLSIGNLTVEQASFAIDLIWTYKTSCYGVTLINQNPDNIEAEVNIYYDPTLKTIMNEEGQFALNSRKGSVLQQIL